jgi:hypothetical protein
VGHGGQNTQRGKGGAGVPRSQSSLGVYGMSGGMGSVSVGDVGAGVGECIFFFLFFGFSIRAHLLSVCLLSF